jgi:tetratricopeptide (TPR) repeat protein
MKLNLLILVLFAGINSQAAEPSEFALGRAFYTHGDFKKAAAHFELALKSDPNAETYYWTGMSYQSLADIALPFNGKYLAKARLSLTRATELAPNRLDYRRELFDFLLDSAASSRSAMRQAKMIVLALRDSDPDYDLMHQRLDNERRVNSSPETRLSRVFLAVPRTAYSIAELPVSALPGRHQTGSAATIEQ